MALKILLVFALMSNIIAIRALYMDSLAPEEESPLAPVSNPQGPNPTSRYINTSYTITTPATSSPSALQARSIYGVEKKICSGVHIRNDLKSFDQLRGCHIIDGPLTIALVSNHTHPYQPKDYENITFPDLFEVTEYLLFFRVQGLTTLTKLFPSLAVIRGKELVSNYALIIYEMMHLQKINLPNLTDILRGSVRIESNPNLCYVSSVNWTGICKHAFTPHFIRDNNAHCKDECSDKCSSPSPVSTNGTSASGSDAKRMTFCWSSNVCHNFCDPGNSLPRAINSTECCAPQCAGGCSAPGNSEYCLSCRNVWQIGKCVEHCDQSLYEYKGKCLSEQECLLMVEPPQQDQCSRTEVSPSPSNLKAIKVPGEKHGRCQTSCPPGFEEDSTNKNKCKPCDKGKCRLVCSPPQDNRKPFMVTSVSSLRELSGCNVINGSLEISMKGGKNVLYELETVFQELEEIKGYLKITRSDPILTLGFLSRLRFINGSELDRNFYSLIIIDNPNLQELFTFNKSDSNQKQLKILEGKIFVHLNPKLCPHRIEHLKSYASVAEWDERDVSIHTNGDKEACNTQKLDVQFTHGTARAANIRFENFAIRMDDPRSLLYYLINYREAPNGAVTMFDGRDGCNSNKDVWITIEEPPVLSKNPTDSSYQNVIISVKPATRYALYIKTFSILGGSTGALSDIIYFETAPDTPGIPRQIEASADSPHSLTVNWSPPSRPNGVLQSYSITISKAQEFEDFQNIDICDSVSDREKATNTINSQEQSAQTTAPKTATNTTSSNENSLVPLGTCPRTTSIADLETHAEVVTFQDIIIDMVYLKQPCPLPINPNRTLKKRSIAEQPAIITSPKSEPESYGSSASTDSSSKIYVTTISSNPAPTYPTVSFVKGRNKSVYNVSASLGGLDSRLGLIIDKLEHFSLYTIEVVACHGDLVGNKTKLALSKTYSRCSIQAMTQIRTKPIDGADMVPWVKFDWINDTVPVPAILWSKPEHPNGIILAYRVRYRPDEAFAIWTEACINNMYYNRVKGFILPRISPGKYVANVMAVTMHVSKWTPDLPFTIPATSITATVAVIIIFSLISLLVAMASGTYYYQKKRDELNVLYASVNPDYVQYDPDDWEVDKSNLIIGAQIGIGSFGMVFKGQLIMDGSKANCAIKTVPPTATTKQRMDFLREASIMKQFDTYHVVKLMGVVSTSTPAYVIMEYMENGDLKSFLRAQREIHQKEKKVLVDGIYLMAAQIADGMAYLASKKYVHRDLAARNCMVGENRVVKVGDFGLTRDIYENDYYRRDTGQARLPVRWMAPESLFDNLYTSASDVWSYGVVVWEMVTFSAYPYQGQSNEEVVKRVGNGYTMPRPENCPDKLHHIMERCWRRNDKDRLTFNEIVELLLPDTEDKSYLTWFHKKQKTEGDSIAQPITGENNVGAESYPLLSWPSNRANGLTNGVNHIQSDLDRKTAVPIP